MDRDSENFVPAVCAYHRCMATRRYREALEYAKQARESSPCDLEAANWAMAVDRLEERLESNTRKVMRFLGFKRSVRA